MEISHWNINNCTIIIKKMSLTKMEVALSYPFILFKINFGLSWKNCISGLYMLVEKLSRMPFWVPQQIRCEKVPPDILNPTRHALKFFVSF